MLEQAGDAVAQNVGRAQKHPTHEAALFFGLSGPAGITQHGLFLGGDSVQDHLDAGLAAQGGVDGQIIVVGIAPAVLGVVVVVAARLRSVFSISSLMPFSSCALTNGSVLASSRRHSTGA